MTHQRTVALDFDGVLNTYIGWKGDNELFQPRSGVLLFLTALKERGYKIVVYSTRPAESIERWLKKYDLIDYVDGIFNQKPLAYVYVDDRAITFDGSFSNAFQKIIDFKAHWE